jgi:hypothetical protein
VTSDPPNPAVGKQGFLRKHGLTILCSTVASSLITIFVMLGIQGYFSRIQAERLAAQAKGLELSLLGKWVLIESTPPRPPEIKAGEEWQEFRPDGTLRDRSITTISGNGKVTDQSENIQVMSYKVVDGDHILLNPGGREHLIKVVLVGDELTLHQQYGGVMRYRRAPH